MGTACSRRGWATRTTSRRRRRHCCSAPRPTQWRSSASTRRRARAPRPPRACTRRATPTRRVRVAMCSIRQCAMYVCMYVLEHDLVEGILVYVCMMQCVCFFRGARNAWTERRRIEEDAQRMIMMMMMMQSSIDGDDEEEEEEEKRDGVCFIRTSYI